MNHVMAGLTSTSIDSTKSLPFILNAIDMHSFSVNTPLALKASQTLDIMDDCSRNVHKSGKRFMLIILCLIEPGPG